MKFWLKFLVLILALIGLSTLIKSVVDNYRGERHAAVEGKNSILHLDLKGVILNGEQFLKNLKTTVKTKPLKLFS